MFLWHFLILYIEEVSQTTSQDLMESKNMSRYHAIVECVEKARIFLFTGENSYALREERRHWVESFTSKHGIENLLVYPGSGLRVRDLLDSIATAPFLAENRLVVVEGLPLWKAAEIVSVADVIHPQVVLLFLDIGGGRRPMLKEFQKIAQVREFPLLSTKALEQWMQAFLAARGGRGVAPAARARLRETLGDDQDFLATELEKLAIAAGDREILPEDIDVHTIPAEGVLWRLTDLLVAGKTGEALRVARHLRARGADAHAIWNLLLAFLKNVVRVAAVVAEGTLQAPAIAAQAGVPFFAARALLPFARRTALPVLRSALDAAVAADSDLKTGALRATEESPEELLALIDRFILTFPGDVPRLRSG